jgi:hypothetical protein
MEYCIVPIVPIGTTPSFPDVVFKEIGRPFFSVLDIDAHFVGFISVIASRLSYLCNFGMLGRCCDECPDP